ncbi:MAG: hypothetical protein SF069_02865 [Phycisphaerae bacterium]|nr:hypothetical protein [Phycisphaerae bacterium]
MRRTNLILALLLGLAFAQDLFAQSGAPPRLVSGPDWFLARDELLEFDPMTGDLLFFPFDPDVDIVTEGDVILVEFTISGEDIDDEMQGNMNATPNPDEEDLDIFVRPRATFVPLPGYPSPVATPLIEAKAEFILLPQAFIFDDNVEDQRRLQYVWVVPQWNGRNQARLRGLIDWDVSWLIDFSTAFEADPELDAIATFSQSLFAIKDSRFLGPNPPPFADAGSDRTIAAGSTIELDGGQTFDGTNIGFDPQDGQVFERDNLTFTWEWVAGPVRVDPSYPDVTNRPEIAEVTLTQVGVYEFRLLVDDNVNDVPSSDTVLIEVVSSLPANRAPIASIQDLTGPVVVGGIIQLNGGGSNDPDGDVLRYRWVQTNSIGGTVDPAVFVDQFQPLAGLDDPVSQWQALKPGTYYFRLLVSDGLEQDSDTTVVQVVSTSAGGVASPRVVANLPSDIRDRLGLPPLAAESESPNPSVSAPLSPAPSLCGGLPLGLLGLSLMGLWVMKRRGA